MVQVKVVYFDVKARAEVTRIALHAAKQEFEDKRINHEEFAAIKPTCPLKQMPIMEVDGSVICQSTAHYVYAGLKSGLLPTDPFTAALVMQVVSTIDELSSKVVAAYRNDTEELKEAAKKKFLEQHVPLFLGGLSEMCTKYGKDGYAVGDKLTIADLNIMVLVDSLFDGSTSFISKDIIQAYPVLLKVAEVARADPIVKAYYESKTQ